ncbi:MAG: hypothetical protein Ta2B_23470 [Termitinemataceae bacterium]|nr:MAG: hypothetical protein Ta2B_23470 [Termitinemataceae bacterium]
MALNRSLKQNMFVLLIFPVLALVSCFSTNTTTPPPPLLPRAEYEPLTPAWLKQIDKESQKNGTPDVTRVQYYLSSDITLIRDELNTNTRIVSVPAPDRVNQKTGDVYQTKERNIEKIIFKKETPGILKQVNGMWQLGISFDTGNNNILWFSQSQNNDRGLFYLDMDGGVLLGGKVFIASLSNEEIPHLLIRIDVRNKIDVNKKEHFVTGNKLP